SLPGRGYSLMKGYFLPPLSFTTDEATMLLLGSDLMAQSFDAQYRSAALAASRKIEGVLPEKLREEVRSLQDSIRFVTTNAMEQPGETENCCSCGAPFSNEAPSAFATSRAIPRLQQKRKTTQ